MLIVRWIIEWYNRKYEVVSISGTEVMSKICNIRIVYFEVLVKAVRMKYNNWRLGWLRVERCGVVRIVCFELGMRSGWIWYIEYVNNVNEWVCLNEYLNDWLDDIRICYNRRMNWLKRWNEICMKWIW